MVAWREAAAQSGWRSLAAFPIRQEGEIRGVLAVYAGQKDFFGAQEQALIEEAAGDVSFGLDFLLTAQRRKQAEEGLTQANADLERKVEERTAQLVEANGSLQAFANTAAHDLRSPLRGIMGFTSMVLEGGGAGLGAEERALLERARASAEQMGRLLDDLLEYSRMHEAQIRLEPIDLGQGVSEALALLEADIRGKNAVVSVVEPLPRVMGHAATIVVLVNNLVSNALKFVPAGVQPQIRIWAEQRGSSVRLWVEDNGIGVGREDLERVFGAFERLHGKGAYPGTGLGLAIVRKGAQRMGGQAGVESEMGRGSRFWVELKAADAARRGEQPQRH
jgi:signal transduction histidine kinase